MRTIVAILAVLIFIWRVIKLIIQIKEAISDSKDNQEVE